MIAILVAAPGLATLAADLRHVFAILADRLAALAAGFAGFLGTELMGVSAFVRGAAAFAGDFALFLGVHSRETTAAATLVLLLSRLLVGHCLVLLHEKAHAALQWARVRSTAPACIDAGNSTAVDS